MVTLRSDRKLAAIPVDSTPTRSRKSTGTTGGADRSVTPDRGSQDSTLRRSQRVRKRQSMLGIIPEDTANSAESPVEPQQSPQQSPHAAESSHQQPAAEQLAEPSSVAVAEATEAAAEAATLDTSASPTSTQEQANELATTAQEVSASSDQPVSSDGAETEPDSDSDIAASSEAEADANDSDNDELLAQLSESMWASLRPESSTLGSNHPGFSNRQPHQQPGASVNTQSVSTLQHGAAGDHEEEMHWRPLTGLPEPLSAAACRGPGLKSDKKAHLLEKQLVLPPRDTRPLVRQQRKLAPETAGKQWFDLPAPQMTAEVKRDLKLLQLRGTFDPKRFYKSSDHKKSLPKFFQIGTVVESAADFYSGRLTNHERKGTITEELLADPELSQVRKRRFNKLQDEKQYWANKRGRKTGLPRLKKNDRSKAKRMSR